MTEKFDPYGSYEYSSKPLTFLFWVASAFVIYTWWAMTFPWLVVVRPFSDTFARYSWKGRTNISLSHPWHIPYNRWLASYLTLFIMIGLMTLLAVNGITKTGKATISGPTSVISWIEVILMVWAVGVMVDWWQELYSGYLSRVYVGIKFSEVMSAFSYNVYFTCRLLYNIDVHHRLWSTSVALQVLSRGQDALALAVFLIYVRSLGLFDVSPSMGPFVIIINRIMARDVSRFLTIVVIFFLGFVTAMCALFAEECDESSLDSYGKPSCLSYTRGWDFDWNRSRFTGATAILLLQVFGGSEPSAFTQKSYTGITFYILFMATSTVLLMNLFIAMLADTYSEVKQQAASEYKFTRALVIYQFGSREAVYPPLNVFHVVFGFIGNNVRRTLWGEGNYTNIPLQKEEPGHQFFQWYYPTGISQLGMGSMRQRIFKSFVSCFEVRLSKAQTAMGMVPSVQTAWDLDDYNFEQGEAWRNAAKLWMGRRGARRNMKLTGAPVA